MVIGKYFNDNGELEIIVELERDELFDCVKPSVRRIKILIDGDVNWNLNLDEINDKEPMIPMEGGKNVN